MQTSRSTPAARARSKTGSSSPTSSPLRGTPPARDSASRTSRPSGLPPREQWVALGHRHPHRGSRPRRPRAAAGPMPGRPGHRSAARSRPPSTAWRANRGRRRYAAPRGRPPAPHRPRAPGPSSRVRPPPAGVGRTDQTPGLLERLVGRPALPGRRHRLEDPGRLRRQLALRIRVRADPAALRVDDGRDPRDQVAEVVGQVRVVAGDDALVGEVPVAAEGDLPQEVVAQRIDAEVVGQGQRRDIGDLERRAVTSPARPRSSSCRASDRPSAGIRARRSRPAVRCRLPCTWPATKRSGISKCPWPADDGPQPSAW